MSEYALGANVVVQGTFTNTSGAVADPTAVFISTFDPEGETVTKEYGVDDEVTKSSTGVYQCVVDANKHGEWWYRWWSTGSGKAAAEGSFTVNESKFVNA